MRCPICGGLFQFTCEAYGTITDDDSVIIENLVLIDVPGPKLRIYCESGCELPRDVKRRVAEFLVPFDAFGRPPGCEIENWEARRPPHDPRGYSNEPVPFDGDGLSEET